MGIVDPGPRVDRRRTTTRARHGEVEVSQGGRSVAVRARLWDEAVSLCARDLFWKGPVGKWRPDMFWDLPDRAQHHARDAAAERLLAGWRPDVEMPA